MPVNVAVGDVWRFSLRGSFLGQPVVNSVHLIIVSIEGVDVKDSNTGANLVAVPSPLQTFLVQACNEAFTLREASCQWIYRTGEVWPGSTRLTYRSALNVPGLVAGQPLPGQPSMTVSAYGQIGATKAIRGGIRVAGLTELQIEDGLILPSFISSIQAEANALFLNQWAIEDMVTFEPVIWSNTYWKAGTHSPYFAAVDVVNIRQTPGTIRRRKEFSSTGGYPV